MPRYYYKCKNCDIELTKFHGMEEKLTDCIDCNTEGALFRVPVAFATHINNFTGREKPGEVVKRHIEEAKKEIEQEKQNLVNKDYLS
tara:strand:+ start:339 stop:599 length:261 start_codon:yes stop_codon:yes gene_type:complete